MKLRMDDRDDVLRTSMLDIGTKMTISLNELDNSNNLEDGKLSNTLFTYYVTGLEYFTCFKSCTPQYKELKNDMITSLTLKITYQAGNIITNGPGMTIVLHRNYNPPLKMEYGNKLGSECSLRTPKGIKGTRQKVIVTHNPSEIGQNQLLMVKFPNLAIDDVIIPGTANLSFSIELTSTADPNRILVSNIGRAIVQKLAVKFEGKEILCIDNFDIFAYYRDLWKTASEKKNAIHQGIISTDHDLTPNCMKLRINAGNKDATNTQDNAIAEAYGNKFIIPLDFEMSESVMPYYQVGLGNRLCYEIMTNYYNQVINSLKTNATYKIKDISLEYEIVTQPTLAKLISDEYQSMVLLQNSFQMNIKVWSCCMTKFSGIDKFQ